MNKRKGWVIFMTEKRIYDMIVEILRIKDEPENLIELDRWIQTAGIDTVFKKVIQINTNCYIS